MATFRLHLDTAGTATDPAEVDDDQESIFPHTPRLDDRCFETTVSEALVVECVRPGSCAVPAEAPERDFLHRRCVQIGHASNERKETLMAHSWFQCAYACKASMTELLSATNMRLNLGQWYLCRQLYAHIIGLELTPEQREITTRKQGEVSKYIDAAAGVADPSTRLTAAEELKELLDAPRSNAGQTDRDEARKLLGLLRVCGHAANKAGDFEAAQTWFDCAYALGGMSCDLLSGANMRAKLVPTSAVALAIYQHLLALTANNPDGVESPPSASHLQMATEKLRAVEAARSARDAARVGVEGLESAREYF